MGLEINMILYHLFATLKEREIPFVSSPLLTLTFAFTFKWREKDASDVA